MQSVASLQAGDEVPDSYIVTFVPSTAQHFASGCQTVDHPDVAYQGLKGNSVIGSVVEPNGGALPAGTPSRLFFRNGW